jgi:cytochrome b6-f complex iron-sulfur subunit
MDPKDKTPKQAIVAENVQTPTEGMDRRTFIKWVGIGWVAFAAVVAGYGTMVMRYLFPNVLFEPKQSFRAGYPNEYQVGEVSERWKDQHGVWLVRDSEKIFALSTVCTHLGCTPNWLANEDKFKCPCHGSGFYTTGINFEGPAPRPLERFKITLGEDGEIIVDKSVKFQYEKGEWNDPESRILV